MDKDRALTILGLELGASPREIKQAYLDLVQICHPDKHRGQSERVRAKAEKQFKEVGQAYELLKSSSGNTRTQRNSQPGQEHQQRRRRESARRREEQRQQQAEEDRRRTLDKNRQRQEMHEAMRRADEANQRKVAARLLKKGSFPVVASLVLLVFFAMEQPSRGVYLLLRMLVFGTGIYLLVECNSRSQVGWAWTMAGVIVFYNPFIMLGFPYITWAWLDLLTAVLLVIVWIKLVNTAVTSWYEGREQPSFW